MKQVQHICDRYGRRARKNFNPLDQNQPYTKRDRLIHSQPLPFLRLFFYYFIPFAAIR